MISSKYLCTKLEVNKCYHPNFLYYYLLYNCIKFMYRFHSALLSFKALE